LVTHLAQMEVSLQCVRVSNSAPQSIGSNFNARTLPVEAAKQRKPSPDLALYPAVSAALPVYDFLRTRHPTSPLLQQKPRSIAIFTRFQTAANKAPPA
jgi:hypothetical protein